MTATDDESAVLEARQRTPGALKCEVWEGSRLVAKLDIFDLENDRIFPSTDSSSAPGDGHI
ncbi:MAG: hypothetical protein V4696_08790 [Pseudomonadota bacterium]